ncbi:MAG: hypothetical protein K6T90_02170 [Leptolyngbyaceae cyanobacterium HOT.MB2.61]|nr:hypothetical protein [Leptolyngbyaceae cyanobacterium HOT.MB2.61]
MFNYFLRQTGVFEGSELDSSTIKSTDPSYLGYQTTGWKMGRQMTAKTGSSQAIVV